VRSQAPSASAADRSNGIASATDISRSGLRARASESNRTLSALVGPATVPQRTIASSPRARPPGSNVVTGRVPDTATASRTARSAVPAATRVDLSTGVDTCGAHWV
jgi:hypothetical protein